MPKIDFADIKGDEPIPAGEYLATLVDAKEGMSSSNNPKIDCQWKIEGGEHDGRRVFDTLPFHPNALFRTKAILAGLGYPKNYSGEITAEELIGKTATLILSIEVSDQVDENGDAYPDRNRIKKVTQKAPAAGTNKAGLFTRK